MSVGAMSPAEGPETRAEKGAKMKCLDCDEPVFRDGSMCREHGCHVCGFVILADTEDWETRLCAEHFEELDLRFNPPRQS